MAELARNTVVLSDYKKTLIVPVTIKTGITEKTEVAPNILPFLMITDFKLTENPLSLNQFTIYEPKLKDTYSYQVINNI